MIKFINILNEVVDSPYLISSPIYKKSSNFSNYIDYEFTTDNKREYYVRFSNEWRGRSKPQDQKYNWTTELTFFPKKLSTSKETEVGDENFGKILATVSKALKEYITKYKPEYVFWKGIKGNKEQINVGDSTKRQRIYNMVMDKMANRITGYTYIKGDKTSGILTKDKIPTPGANKIFTYPEEPSFYNEEEAKKKVSKFNLQR